MPPVGFKPKTPEFELSKISYDLDQEATVIGKCPQTSMVNARSETCLALSKSLIYSAFSVRKY
jgi:hypothetical protein